MIADETEFGDEERFVLFAQFRHQPGGPQGVDVVFVEHDHVGEFRRRIDPLVRLTAAVRGAEPEMIRVIFAEEPPDNPVIIPGTFGDEVGNVFLIQVDNLPIFQHRFASAGKLELRGGLRFAVAADQKVHQSLLGGDGRGGCRQFSNIAGFPAVLIFRGIGDQHGIVFAAGNQRGDLFFRGGGESGIVNVDPAARQQFDGTEGPVFHIRQIEGLPPSPLGSGVEPPANQALPIDLLRFFIVGRSVFLREVGREKIDLFPAGETIRNQLDVGEFGKTAPARSIRIFQWSGVAALPVSDCVATDEEIAVPFRCDEPVAPVDLLKAEMPGGLEFPGIEATSEPVELRRIALLCRVGAELVVGGDFARPLLAGVLAVTVDGEFGRGG